MCFGPVYSSVYRYARKLLMNLEFPRHITFRYVETVYSRRTGAFLIVELNVEAVIPQSVEDDVERMVSSIFSSRVVDSVWIHDKTVLRLMFNLDEVNRSRNRKCVNTRRSYSGSDKSDKITAGLKVVEKKRTSSVCPPQQDKNTRKWSLVEPSDSVKSIRDMWDSIERICSPSGLTHSEENFERILKKEDLCTKNYMEGKIGALADKMRADVEQLFLAQKDTARILDEKFLILEQIVRGLDEKFLPLEQCVRASDEKLRALDEQNRAVNKKLEKVSSLLGDERKDVCSIEKSNGKSPNPGAKKRNRYFPVKKLSAVNIEDSRDLLRQISLNRHLLDGDALEKFVIAGLNGDRAEFNYLLEKY